MSKTSQPKRPAGSRDDQNQNAGPQNPNHPAHQANRANPPSQIDPSHPDQQRPGTNSKNQYR